MQAESSTSECKTSRCRGLSYDKKWQGWRVRIFWMKKQRHVGRYSDEITAAKAYDKAAVYLYGMNAVTNFGLQACLACPIEVSPHIIRAKQEVALEQQRQLQQQQRTCSAVQPATPNRDEGSTLQRCSPTMPQVLIPDTSMQQVGSLHMGTLVYAAPTATASLPSSSSSSSSGAAIHSGTIVQQQQQQQQQQQMPVLLCYSDPSAGTPLSVSSAASAQSQLEQQHSLPVLVQSMDQTMQVPVQPQLITSAPHMSAAPVSAAASYHADNLLGMLSPPVPAPSRSNSVVSTSPWCVTTTAAAAAALPTIPVASVGLPVATYELQCGNSRAIGMGLPLMAQLPHVVQQYSLPHVTALHSTTVAQASPFDHHQQQQLQETLCVSRTSSSCSPVAAAAQLLNPVASALFFGC